MALGRPDEVGLDALTHAERRDYDALLYEGRRRDWLAGRVAAKRAVAERFGIRRLDHVRLESRTRQAPIAFVRDANGWHSLPASISVAHIAGWSIAAAADQSYCIGVDIDLPDAIEAEHARYFLTTRERSTPAMDVAAMWVQKEAAWKAFGLGDSDAFSDLELDVGNDLIARAASVRGAQVAVGAAVWAPAPGLIAAAVWTAKEAA